MSLINKTKEEWVGYKQGKLIVIDKVGEKEYISNSAKKQYRYMSDILLVKCDCSKIIKVDAKSFVRNDTKSCRSCSKRRNDIGKRFGKLVVVGWHNKINKSGRSYVIYDCDCDCGNKHSVRNEILLNGECSCCSNCRNSSKKTFNNISIDRYFKNIKYRCKKKQLDFDIDIDFILSLLEKQSYKCKYSNQIISLNDGTASLDRIDNTKGYIKTNIQWVHRTINYMKNEMSDNEFINACLLVANCKG